MIENMAYVVVPGLTLPGHRMIAAVRIALQSLRLTLRGKDRNCPCPAFPVAVFACGLALWAVVRGKDDDVLSSMPSCFSVSRIWPTW